MAKTKEKAVLTRENWISNFNLIGEAVVKNPEYVYKIDERSEKSDWIYNSLNLGVDCGEKHGVVYAEMMGGYGAERANIIYAHGKKDDGTDDFQKKVEVAWEDRNNDDILEQVGDMCFITVGLEKTKQGKTFYKKFLSAYDAIKYVKEHLENGMVVNVKGRLNYSTYQENVQVRKTITSIVLSGVDDKSKYAAHFTQSILLDKYSADLKNIDKDKGVMYVNAHVLEYVKEMNGLEIKGQYPYAKEFEYEFADITNGDRCKKTYNNLFKVKKGITMITFDGDFIENGAVVSMTYDDLPDDIKELVDCGVFTEEQAIEKCSSNGSKERRMVLRTPYVKKVGEEKTPVLQKFEEKYEEDDLIFDFPNQDDEYEDYEGSSADGITEDDDLSFEDVGSKGSEDKTEDSDDSMSWLNEL